MEQRCRILRPRGERDEAPIVFAAAPGLKNRTIYSDGTTPPVTYTYDAAGRLATAANGTDTLTWSYDLAGQLLSEQSTKNSSTVAYTYDANGHRVSVSLDGALFVSYGYDDASRLTTITRGSNVFGFGYDSDNRRTSLSFPNGVNTSYSFDNQNRLLNLAATKGAATITNFTYTYDAAGNRLTKQQPDYTETYGYDALYRLSQAQRTGSLTGLQTWSYDAVGNRLASQQDSFVTTSSYNERNQLLSNAGGGTMLWRGTLDEPGTVNFSSATINGQPARMLAGNIFEANLPMQNGTNTVTITAKDTSGNVATKSYSVDVSGSGATYTYDPNGNLATKVEGADTWVYTWNAEDQLIKVEKNSVEVASFKYDPLGRRVERSAGGLATSFTYDKKQVLRESGASTALHVRGPGDDEPLAREQAGSTSYRHADALSSVVATTNATGSVDSTARYDAWGSIETGAATGEMFTGREWDADAGLYYYRARYYDSKTGRFVSQDPIRWSGGLNLHVYAENRPTLLTDPTGWFGEACDPETCLTCILYAEAAHNQQCMRAVASVIINRVARVNQARPGNPVGICDIVQTPGQFNGYQTTDGSNYQRCRTCSVQNGEASPFVNRVPDLQRVLDFLSHPFDVISNVTLFHDNSIAQPWSGPDIQPVTTPCATMSFYTGNFVFPTATCGR